jgi:hypothetical protein
MNDILAGLKKLAMIAAVLLLAIVAILAVWAFAQLYSVSAPAIQAGSERPDSFVAATAASQSRSREDPGATAARVLPEVGSAPGTAATTGVETSPRTYSTEYERLIAPRIARLNFEKARVEVGYGIVVRDTFLPILQTLLAAVLGYLFAVQAAPALRALAEAVQLRASAQQLDAEARLEAAKRR